MRRALHPAEIQPMLQIDSITSPARTDEALVARVRAGDPHAFAEISARYRRPLLDFARQRLGTRREEAEDVVQDAFIRAYRALRTGEREVELRPWLYRIVHNRAVDELRRPVRTMPLEEPERIRVAESLAADPGVREELAAVVADVIALPARQREALVALAVDGIPHEELARRLGTTVAGSKALVNRARGSMIAARDARERSEPLLAA